MGDSLLFDALGSDQAFQLSVSKCKYKFWFYKLILV